MSRECAFCFGNFKIQGTKHTSVPLFNSSSNKEIVTLVKGLQNVDTIILSVLLSHIGIKLQKEKFNRRSVCKKCARKVISMYNIFVEICEAVKRNGLRSLTKKTHENHMCFTCDSHVFTCDFHVLPCDSHVISCDSHVIFIMYHVIHM